jgi:hypothetical protein
MSMSLFFITSRNELAYTNTVELQFNTADILHISEYPSKLHGLSPHANYTDRLNYQSAAIRSRWFFARGFFYPEDVGDTFLRNVGSHKMYTAPHPRRRHSS